MSATPPDAESWNACRRPNTPRGHVESYFCKLNSPDARRALWLKATLRIPAPGAPAGDAPTADAWAIAFERGRPPRAVRQTIPLDRARFGEAGLDVAVGDLFWRHGKLAGGVAGPRGDVRVDLRYQDSSPPLVPLPAARLYTGPLPSSKFVSPCPDARFDGTYSLDGETIEVAGWAGMQGHNWGRGHAHRYAWGHCNVWDNVGADEALIFEGVTARVRVGPVVAPPLTLLTVAHRGVRHLFNAPRTLLAARGEHDLRRWRFSAAAPTGARVEGAFEADGPDFAGLIYDNPAGPPTHCLNSKLARGVLRLHLPGRPPLEAHTRAAALEIATHETHHGVTLLA